ncbi:MAG: MmcQ/YjbR family DNA-binding protein [Gammaproteobacteria bacterium]|jgi:predicted DNA-binding protein (MmcQ/YjbR family)|nr:hypothetical protein [Gammaproteobacteria bacterium]MDP6096209.1 MmcQ/YjbR family DNA-binding protein [Gammaproteobacteria bacterium]|tara:strand:- start:1272 stop:1631 length:360 start_codon:yes stop_codon:yes gene_type:complete
MNYQQAKKYLLAKPEAIEDYPFGPDVMVPKIKGKMFATLGTENGIGRVNLKCDPNEALALRDIFSAVIPGYHMNKKHWNTVILDGSIPSGEIARMFDNSYKLVVRSLPKARRESLAMKQ